MTDYLAAGKEKSVTRSGLFEMDSRRASQKKYAYDDAGNLTSMTDSKGNTSQFFYDDPGDADGSIWSYDGTLCTPAAHNPPLAGYAAAYLRKVVDPAGLKTIAKYDSCRGTLKAYTDPNAALTTYGHDQYGRRTQINLPSEATGQGQITVNYAEL